MEPAVKKLTMDQRLGALRAERGDTIALEEIAQIAESLMTSVDGEMTSAEWATRKEIADLLAFLRDARSEIANIRPHTISRRDIPAATDELDAVVKSTEAATFTILNAAETLSALAANTAPEQSEILNQVVMDIYEASNFQDISGQRINKVVKTLRIIEERLNKLATTLGLDSDDEPVDLPQMVDLAKGPLDGPALPGSASSQDDIDALFDSL
jgi:chemotaxis protein CheZ